MPVSLFLVYLLTYNCFIIISLTLNDTLVDVTVDAPNEYAVRFLCSLDVAGYWQRKERKVYPAGKYRVEHFSVFDIGKVLSLLNRFCDEERKLKQQQ